ncbi:hypothetical protein L1887_57276 [Cichorium endivia]|nr:hypothetical protein L1887_57276 [Cichorium endivia]
MSLVSQEPTLYDGTIEFNIRLGAFEDADTVSMDDLRAAAASANILAFIESLPDKWDTEGARDASVIEGRLPIRARLLGGARLDLGRVSESVEPGGADAALVRVDIGALQRRSNAREHRELVHARAGGGDLGCRHVADRVLVGLGRTGGRGRRRGIHEVRLGVRHLDLERRLGGVRAHLGGGVADDLAHVGQVARHGARGGHGGRHEVRASAGALATLKVAVRGGGAALAGRQLVRVHAQAHGAARLAPVEAGGLEDLVEALRLGLLLDQSRAGHEHAVQALGDLAAVEHARGGAQILDARVGARTDEDLVDLDLLHGRAGLEAHVLEGALHGLGLAVRLGVLGVGDGAGDGDDVLGRGAPGDGGRDVLGVDLDDRVVVGALVAGERLPVGERLVPGGALLGSERAAVDVLVGDLVRGDEAGAGTGLDGHVADGHARLHGEGADGGAGVLDDVAGTAGGADDADDVEDDVFGGDAFGKLAVDLDEHVLGALLENGLGGEHVLYLGGADTKGERAKGTVGGGVRVTAHDGGAGKREALLGADDVDDALAVVRKAEEGETERLDIVLEGETLGSGVGLLDKGLGVLVGLAGGGGDVVVYSGEGAVGPAHLATGVAETLEGLWGGDLVDEVAVDVEEAGAIGLLVDEEDGKMEGCAEALLNNAVRGGGAAKTPARLGIGIGWGGRSAAAERRRSIEVCDFESQPSTAAGHCCPMMQCELIGPTAGAIQPGACSWPITGLATVKVSAAPTEPPPRISSVVWASHIPTRRSSIARLPFTVLSPLHSNQQSRR